MIKRKKNVVPLAHSGWLRKFITLKEMLTNSSWNKFQNILICDIHYKTLCAIHRYLGSWKMPEVLHDIHILPLSLGSYPSSWLYRGKQSTNFLIKKITES